MNKKTANITSKRIERKITNVTLILGFVITNIIWIVGNDNTNEQPHTTSITQIKVDSDRNEKIVNNQSFVSYQQAKLDY